MIVFIPAHEFGDCNSAMPGLGALGEFLPSTRYGRSQCPLVGSPFMTHLTVNDEYTQFRYSPLMQWRVKRHVPLEEALDCIRAHNDYGIFAIPIVRQISKVKIIMKVFRTVFFGLTVALGLQIGVPHSAYAGKVTLDVSPGTTASIAWGQFAEQGGDGASRTGTDPGNTGKITIVVADGSLAEEKKLGTVWVTKKINGEPQHYEIKLDASGNTLASLEPFDIPSFVAVTSLFVSINMVDLLSNSNPFTIGQSVSVTNGIIAESSAIVFKDASSLLTNVLFSRDLVDSLPNFTGTASVFSFDRAAPVPEPSTLPLVGLSVLAILGCRRKTKSPNKACGVRGLSAKVHHAMDLDRPRCVAVS